MQTLASIDLTYNEISATGAEYLAHGLENNTVGKECSPFPTIYSLLYFTTDTH